MEWTIYGEKRQNHPTKEGWYLTLFRDQSNGEVIPMPVYFQFAWITPKDIYGTIEYYTEIDNLPLDLINGRLW